MALRIYLFPYNFFFFLQKKYANAGFFGMIYKLVSNIFIRFRRF